MRIHLGLLFGLACYAGACSSNPDSRAAAKVLDPARPWRKPGDKIDSMLPMEEYVRRFRIGLSEPTQLDGGEISKEVLARRYLTAVAARDSATLQRLLVSKAEFAWLVFPDHLYMKPPYELDPDIFWLQLGLESTKGATRVLNRYGGSQLTFLALGCQRDTLQIVSGPDTVWSHCNLRYRANDSTLTRELFGSIVQRGGRYKFLSYHSEF